MRDAGCWMLAECHHPPTHGARVASLGARQELVLCILAEDSLQLVTWTAKVMRVVGNTRRVEEAMVLSFGLAMNGAPALCLPMPKASTPRHYYLTCVILCRISAS
jgi:hypothetical protein